jgi:hypothetical protein
MALYRRATRRARRTDLAAGPFNSVLSFYKVPIEKTLKNVLMVPKKVAEILRTPKSKAQPPISDKPDRVDVYDPSAGPGGQIRSQGHETKRGKRAQRAYLPTVSVGPVRQHSSASQH